MKNSRFIAVLVASVLIVCFSSSVAIAINNTSELNTSSLNNTISKISNNFTTNVSLLNSNVSEYGNESIIYSNITNNSSNYKCFNNSNDTHIVLKMRCNYTVNFNNCIPSNNSNNCINTCNNCNNSNANFLNTSINGYKVVVLTNGIPFGYVKNTRLKFIKIGENKYIISPVILNASIELYSKFRNNEILHKTVFLNYSGGGKNKDIHYLNVSYDNCRLIIKTNGQPDAKYENLSVNVNFKKIDNNTYIVYPLLLNNTINIYSKYDNETLNKTVFLNYGNNSLKFCSSNHYLNISVQHNKVYIITNGRPWIYIPNKNMTIYPIERHNHNYVAIVNYTNLTMIIYSKFNNETLNKSLNISNNFKKTLNTTLKYSDKKHLIYKNLSFNFYINKGKFKKFNVNLSSNSVYFEIDNVSKGDVVNLTVESPISIPKGMYIYYWKNLSGKLIPINYTILNNRKYVVFFLKDGLTDEDGTKNGIIVDPFKFYIPMYDVKTQFKNNNKTGVLYITNLKENISYNITVNISAGKLDYLKYVDEKNIPITTNASLPYNLIKFKISNVSKGKKVNINITYSKKLKLKDNAEFRYYKFNPNTLKWYSINAKLINNNTISFNLTDGGLGDDDNDSNGIIVDDGGIGWVGYYGEWDAIIGSLFNQQVHTYWLYVPKGLENYSFGVFDGDGFIVNIYYPNGTLCEVLNESANDDWNYTNITTNGNYGFWKIVVNNSESNYVGGNYYNLNISGNNNLNLKVNMSYDVNGNIYYGTPNATLLVSSSTIISNKHEYYTYEDGNFTIAIYDPDNVNTSSSFVEGNRLRVDIYDPLGNLIDTLYPYDNTLRGIFSESDNEVWVEHNVLYNGIKGYWKIVLTQEVDYSDSESNANQIILAVNSSSGLLFKKPNISAAISDSGQATIGRDNQKNMVHRYYVLIPYGISNYTLGVYDGDGLIVNVSYPNGQLYGSYTAPNNAQSGEPPNYFQIDTNNNFGWWIVNIFEDSWSSLNGNYYSLSAVNSPVLKFNTSYATHQGYHGTPDAMIVGDNTSALGEKTWYISTPKGLSSYNISLYDGDGAINVSIYLPNGTKYDEFTAYGDEIWYNHTINILNPNQTYGVWKIIVHEINDYDDYLTGGNMYKIATTTKTGILSGNPRYNLSIVNITAPSVVNTSETFNITVYVKNNGTMDMSNVSVNMLLPSDWVGDTYNIIPYLLPNQTVELNFTLTAPSISGNYTLIANITNNYVHWDYDDSKNISISVVKESHVFYNLRASIGITPQGYNISVESYNDTQNVYVYWYKPDNIGVINISGDYDENGTNGNTYWFKFNTINTNETKNIAIETNISTMDGLIIGIDPYKNRMKNRI